MNAPDTKPHFVKRQQQRILLVVGLILCLGVLALIWLANTKAPAKPRSTPHDTFTTPLEVIDDKAFWLQRTENQLLDTEKKSSQLEKRLNQLLQTKKQEEKGQSAQKEKIESLERQLTALEKTLREKTRVPGASKNPTNTARVFPNTSASFSTTEREAEEARRQHIRLDSMTLSASPLVNGMGKTPATYVPAGSFVKAVLLSGLDAASGVGGQSDPRPALLRITEKGTLPRAAHSRLSGCFIVAAGVGDISSERAYLRLERLSCRDDNDALTDFPVYGTVVGPDGKDGVRGTPVWREGALLQRAALAGTFSGFGQAISKSFTTQSISPLGSTASVNSSDIFKVGAAQGASNALEKLADYNIKRAEQYQPVIQIPAGVLVDVLFLKGFYLDGRKDDKTT